MAKFYEWNPTRRFSIDAQIVGEAVEQITEAEGGCSPQSLVNLARSESSPLHSLFEWRDGVAASKWRSAQAGFAIRSLRVVRVERVGSNEAKPPAFISISETPNPSVPEEYGDDDHAPGYYATDVVRDDPEMRYRAVKREWAQIKGWLRRTEWIEEFAPLRAQIESVERQIDAILARKAA